VVIIEPLYDWYLLIIRRVGGISKLVTIRPADRAMYLAALCAASSGKTKLLLLNTPQNPASKIYSRVELEAIAVMVKEFGAIAIYDEVYEHVTFDGREHILLMSLLGMRERTIRIGPAGKTFSMTGWKIGYLTEPAELMHAVSKAHQFLVFITPPNLQRTVAFGLTQDDSYSQRLNDSMRGKRDRLSEALDKIPDFELELFIRFHFAKQDQVLDDAAARLAAHFG